MKARSGITDIAVFILDTSTGFSTVTNFLSHIDGASEKTELLFDVNRDFLTCDNFLFFGLVFSFFHVGLRPESSFLLPLKCRPRCNAFR